MYLLSFLSIPQNHSHLVAPGEQWNRAKYTKSICFRFNNIHHGDGISFILVSDAQDEPGGDEEKPPTTVLPKNTQSEGDE